MSSPMDLEGLFSTCGLTAILKAPQSLGLLQVIFELAIPGVPLGFEGAQESAVAFEMDKENAPSWGVAGPPPCQLVQPVKIQDLPQTIMEQLSQTHHFAVVAAPTRNSHFFRVC